MSTTFGRFGTAALASAVFIAGPAVGHATTPSPPSSAAGGDLGAAVEAFVGDSHGGAVALIVRDGETTTAAAGVANAAGEPMTPDTVFRIGSLSKPFVATMVLQLFDEGEVDLDAPLSTYLPDTPIGGNVTIRDLLRHRSGLPNYVDSAEFITDALADRDRVFTAEELFGYIADVPPGEPDQEYLYSQTNYLLLGQVIEELDATDVNAVLANRITGPLGLESTHFALPGGPVVDALAGGWHPAVVEGDPAAPYDSIASGAGPGGAVASTAGELNTFLSALFNGELTSDRALTEMTDPGPDEYGLGLGYFVLPSGTALYGHDGEIYGYVSFMAIEPVSGDTLVILANNSELQLYELAEELLADW